MSNAERQRRWRERHTKEQRDRREQRRLVACVVANLAAARSQTAQLMDLGNYELVHRLIEGCWEDELLTLMALLQLQPDSRVVSCSRCGSQFIGNDR
jgi:hypothetical protein